MLEGIALTGDPDFAIVDEAYPYVAKRLLTDKHPRLQAALRYMVRFFAMNVDSLPCRVYCRVGRLLTTALALALTTSSGCPAFRQCLKGFCCSLP